MAPHNQLKSQIKYPSKQTTDSSKSSQNHHRPSNSIDSASTICTSIILLVQQISQIKHICNPVRIKKPTLQSSYPQSPQHQSNAIVPALHQPQHSVRIYNTASTDSCKYQHQPSPVGASAAASVRHRSHTSIPVHQLQYQPPPRQLLRQP